MEWKPVMMAFGVGLFIGAVCMFLLADQLPVSPTSVKLRLVDPSGQGAAEFEVQGTEINYENILQHMFSDALLGPGVKGWLQANQRLYPLNDTALVDAIKQDLCEPIPPEPLETRLAKAREFADSEVASRLRSLCSDRKTPFHYVGIKSRLGVPEGTRPPQGRANVCREHGLLGRRLEVIDPASRQRIEVEATGHYQCTGFTNYPDLQLSSEDALRLFGRPLNRLEEAIVVPLT